MAERVTRETRIPNRAYSGEITGVCLYLKTCLPPKSHLILRCIPSRKDKQRSQTANKWLVSEISVWNGFTSGEKLGRFTHRISKFKTTFSLTEWLNLIWSTYSLVCHHGCANLSGESDHANESWGSRVGAAPWREIALFANKCSFQQTESHVPNRIFCNERLSGTPTTQALIMKDSISDPADEHLDFPPTNRV